MTPRNPVLRLLAALAAGLLLGLVPAPAGAAATATPAVGVPAAAPAALGERTLRYRDTGPDVAALQGLLGVRRTGFFGPVTRRTVQDVQRAAGLKATGVVDAGTLKAIRKRTRDAGSSSRALPRAGAPAASQRFAAAYIASRYGWGAAQMSCLKVMWTRESAWQHWVSNPNGKYHGIPQTSWREWTKDGYTQAQYMSSPEIQIKVGARYIKERYGTPCNAWAFWRSHHWY